MYRCTQSIRLYMGFNVKENVCCKCFVCLYNMMSSKIDLVETRSTIDVIGNSTQNSKMVYSLYYAKNLQKTQEDFKLNLYRSTHYTVHTLNIHIFRHLQTIAHPSTFQSDSRRQKTKENDDDGDDDDNDWSCFWQIHVFSCENKANCFKLTKQVHIHTLI